MPASDASGGSKAPTTPKDHGEGETGVTHRIPDYPGNKGGPAARTKAEGTRQGAEKEECAFQKGI